jgi:hypothetical protein
MKLEMSWNISRLQMRVWYCLQCLGVEKRVKSSLKYIFKNLQNLCLGVKMLRLLLPLDTCARRGIKLFRGSELTGPQRYRGSSALCRAGRRRRESDQEIPSILLRHAAQEDHEQVQVQASMAVPVTARVSPGLETAASGPLKNLFFGSQCYSLRSISSTAPPHPFWSSAQHVSALLLRLGRA